MSISQNFPEEGPTLNLNFAGSRILDPRITFTRTQTTSNGSTYMGRDGLIKYAGADEPRFDHRYVNGEVESLGLLIEEQSSNLLSYSVVSTLTWSSINSSIVTNNAATAPDETNTAARIQVDTSGFVAVLNISVTAGQPYTLSFWVKSVSGSSGTWGINIFDHGGGGFHNRTTRNITGEWTRISYTYTPVGNQINIYVSDDRNLLGTILDGYVWGVQLEQNSFATSLIPTEGSTKTRTADNASITGSNFTEWYNQNEGTIFCSFRAQSSETKYLMGISNNSVGELIYIRATVSGSDSAMRDGGSQVAYKPIAYSRDINTLSKHCVSYKQNDFIVSAQGQISTVDDTCTVPTPTNISIGSLYNTTQLGGTIAQLTYYPQRLPNSQLVSLTR